jgi:molecular chaperone HscB
MAWRESLDEARSAADLDVLDGELNRAQLTVLQRIEDLLDGQGDAPAAAQQVRALMFIERFGQDVEARFEQLGQ